MYCTQCGEKLKSEAKFCHACGEAVQSQVQNRAGRDENTGKARHGWLHSFGAFLFIPIFAGIVVLLFWVNKEPEPLKATNNANGKQAEAPSMAAMGQIHQTLERLKANVEANPEDLVSIDSLAIMYSIAGSYDKARMYYEKHLQIEPDNKDIKIALGLTYHNLNNNEKAIALLQEVLDKEPTYAFALHYMGEIQASLHNHEEAEKYWQRIIVHYPGTEMAKIAEQRIQEQTSGE